MKRLRKVKDLIEMELDANVISVIEEQLDILDDSYGAERNIDADLGGYVLILETKDDVIETRESILKGIIPEYVDNIECEGGKHYCLALFLWCAQHGHVLIGENPQWGLIVPTI